MYAIDKQGCEKLLSFAFEVKKQPMMFLKEKSLLQLTQLLQGFIYGYNNACAYGLKGFYEKTKDGTVWLEFQEYFHKKYNTSSIYHTEVSALCGSEEAAFDLFFEELEWYLEEAKNGYKRIDTMDKQGCEKLLRIAFEVKKRPPLFFKEKSFTKLILLLHGFVYGYNSHEQNKEAAHGLEIDNKGVDKETIWSGFQKYFQEKYSTTSIYHTEVLEHCGSEEAAFDLFFEELEQYLTEHGVEIPKVR